jgi:hypothetical protein
MSQRPDLIEMAAANDQNDPAAQQAAESARDEEAAERQRELLLRRSSMPLIDVLQIIASVGLVLVYLVFMMQHVDYPSEYLALTCLFVPNILFMWLLATRHRPSQGKPLAIAGIVSRFALAFVVLLPAIVLLAVLLLSVIATVSTFLGVQGLAATDAVRVLGFSLIVVASEEFVKLTVYLLKDQRVDLDERPEFYIYFGCSVGLGVACSEIFIIVRELIRIMQQTAEVEMRREYETGEAKSKEDFVSPAVVLPLVATLTLLLVPMHVLASYYIGLACAKMADEGVRAVLLPLLMSVIFRTMFLVLVFVVLLPYNFWLGLGVCALVCGVFVWIVMRYESDMPAAYLMRTGSIRSGFSVLATEDQEQAAADGADAANEGSSSEQEQEADGGVAVVNVNSNSTAAVASVDAAPAATTETVAASPPQIGTKPRNVVKFARRSPTRTDDEE